MPQVPAIYDISAASPAAFIVRRFLIWAQRARADDRAAAASALGRAYLHADLAGAVRDQCAVALAALLDDPAVAVRRAMAEAFAAARSAPRALVVALAGDRSDVAAPLLARSPLLTDAELIDCAAAGDSVAQCAVARRPRLGAGPAAALAEVGTRDAALALIGNLDATLTPTTMRRIFERFAGDGEIREALAGREDLPATLRAEIAIATADVKSPAGGRASRDTALAAIAAACPDEDLLGLVRTLRERGALTTALMLRSLLGGDPGLFAAALADLADLAPARAVGLARDPQGAGFAAAALKAGLARHALPAFRAVLTAIATRGPSEGEGLKLELIEAVIGACEARRDPALAPYLALLWRFAAEAARSDARAKARAAARARALPTALDFAPANDDWLDGAAAPTIDATPPDIAGSPAPPIELPADVVLALAAA